MGSLPIDSTIMMMGSVKPVFGEPMTLRNVVAKLTAKYFDGKIAATQNTIDGLQRQIDSLKITMASAKASRAAALAETNVSPAPEPQGQDSAASAGPEV